jgi:hypothetical protein
MLYSDLLKSEKVKEGLTRNGVADIPSPIMKDGDFDIDLTEDHFQIIVDKETLGRRALEEHTKFVADMDEKTRPYRELEEKAQQVRPAVEKLISGKLRGPYATLEKPLTKIISEAIAKEYEFGDDGVSPNKESKRAYTELEKLLAQSSVTFLNRKKSLDDVALHYLVNSEFASMLK